MSRAARILIVDDDEPSRRLLELLLRPEGYETLSAGSGEGALAAVAAHEVDLILLDVGMPSMDGYQVADILKSNSATKSIPIIMVTGHADRASRLGALSAGVEEFLTKPVDRAELWLRVRNLLRLKEYGDFLTDYSVVLERQVEQRTADLQRFRLAMDSTADAILLTGTETMTFLEVNATASAMLGYTRDELLKLGPQDLQADPSSDIAAEFGDIIGSAGSGTSRRSMVRRKDGSVFPAELNQHAHRSGDEWIIVGVLRDITEREAAEERLHHLAHYDALTGLPNRRLFHETLKSTLSFAARRGLRVAIVFLDVDHFKNVNDTLGHATGDKLLVQLGARLVESVRIRDTVGRLGGDEFGLILMVEDDELGAVAVARSIRKALRTPFHLAGEKVTVTVSMGITVYPSDGLRLETLIKYADTAMYGAKQSGRDTFRFFTPQMNSDVRKRLALEQSLRRAIENDEFVLHYQPKVDLHTRRVVGLEALLRWQRPNHGLVPPNQFVPLLEETGLIGRVGTWVIGEACRQIAAWSATDIGPRKVAVNVSGRQFLDRELDDDIATAILAHGVRAGDLELELTEISLMANTERTLAALHRLRARGVRVSIDDFGTGYSCLAYLQQFPIDQLKIDIAFIRNVTTSPADAAMTETIIRMAHSLSMEVVAEGVETVEQLDYLMRRGCDQIQGYYFSRPLPAAEIETLLRADPQLVLPEGARERRTTVLLVEADGERLASLERLLHQDGHRLLTASSSAEGLQLMKQHDVQVVVYTDDLALAQGPALLRGGSDLGGDTLFILLSAGSYPWRGSDAARPGALYGFHTRPWDGEALRDNVREAGRHHRRLHQHSGAAAAPAHSTGIA